MNAEMEKEILAFLDRCVTDTDGLRFRYTDKTGDVFCPLIKDKAAPLLAKLKAAKAAVNEDGTCGTCVTAECCIRKVGGSCSGYTKAALAPKTKRTLTTHYYVEGTGTWFIVRVKNRRAAYSEGVKEFGRGNVKNVRIATFKEVTSFIAQKGERAVEA